MKYHDRVANRVMETLAQEEQFWVKTIHIDCDTGDGEPWDVWVTIADMAGHDVAVLPGSIQGLDGFDINPPKEES